MKVVFVGDRASRLNRDQKVAFVGTPSFINLCKWIVKMQVGDFTMVNSYTKEDFTQMFDLWKTGDKIWVALGNDASKRLNRLSVPHFKLPHPSPRNRKLNNRKFVDSELKKCYRYIKEQENV
jgi:uracil-DNA glycosylase